MTKHSHQVVFGRKVTGCPRCAELSAGRAARRWRTDREPDKLQIHWTIRAHFAPGSPHALGKCGPVSHGV